MASCVRFGIDGGLSAEPRGQTRAVVSWKAVSDVDVALDQRFKNTELMS